MRLRFFLSFAYNIANYSQKGMTVYSAGIALLEKAPRVKPGLVTDVLVWNSENLWWQILLGMLVIAVSALIKYIIGDPWAWEKVHKILDEFRNEAMPGELFKHEAEHRVTLFKHRWALTWNMYFLPGRGVSFWKRFLPKNYTILHPFSGWLVPVERSGHVNRWSCACFSAPDNHVLAEGVAGNQWYLSNTMHVHSLPKLSGQSGEHNINNYAKRTYTTADRVRAQIKNSKKIAQSLYSVRIEINGRPWGVVVLDSTHAQPIRPEVFSDLTRTLCAKLSMIIERLR